MESNKHMVKSIHDINREKRLRKKRKKRMIKKSISVFFVFLFVFAIFFFINNSNKKLFVLRMDGKDVGIVKETEDAKKMIDIIKASIEEKLDTKIEVQYEIEEAKDVKKADNYKDLQLTLKDNMVYSIIGYTILVDGKERASLINANAINLVLNQIKDKYYDKDVDMDFVNNPELLKKYFDNEIEIVKSKIKREDVFNQEEAINILTDTTEQQLEHVLEDGQTIGHVAMLYEGLKTQDIMDANPGLDPTKLQIGQKLKLNIPKTVLSVRKAELREREEKIERKVTVKKLADKSIDYKKVLQEGKDGKKIVKENVVYVNGVENKIEFVSEEIIEEPVEKIIEMGILKPAPKGYIGIFTKPTSGVKTSYYGEQRRGYRHYAIDIANSLGTPIYAMGSGKVTEARYSTGGYGYMIKIKHSNGFETLYAHCKELLVKKGQVVEKGQKIATMGNTGRSTGPHLHYEVIKDGKKVNPSKYIK